MWSGSMVLSVWSDLCSGVSSEAVLLSLGVLSVCACCVLGLECVDSASSVGRAGSVAECDISCDVYAASEWSGVCAVASDDGSRRGVSVWYVGDVVVVDGSVEYVC